MVRNEHRTNVRCRFVEDVPRARIKLLKEVLLHVISETEYEVADDRGGYRVYHALCVRVSVLYAQCKAWTV